MSNYKDWIEAVDIKVDYFSAFMKAWIAFNAWYESGEISGHTDKERIEFIANQSNRFKTYTMALLDNNGIEGQSYRESVAKLHESLLSAAITTQEYIGVCQPISFSEVAFKNTNCMEIIDYYSTHYECSRSHGKLLTVVSQKANGIELFRFEQEEYDLEALKEQSGFQRLTPTQQLNCQRRYKKLRPYIIKSVLDISGSGKKIGAYDFVNDSDKISHAIVTLLYMLRCCLAHGDISPDTTSNNVYHYAYEVLVVPLKKLK